MIKLRYNAETGKVMNAYPENIIVPEPFILITEKQNDELQAYKEKAYVIDGVLKNITGTEKDKELQAQAREKAFNQEFFETSLGYIRRNVAMQNGAIKSFLTDILPMLIVGVPILVYSLPDFTKEVDIVQYQKRVNVTEQFLAECKQRLLADFYG